VFCSTAYGEEDMLVGQNKGYLWKQILVPRNYFCVFLTESSGHFLACSLQDILSSNSEKYKQEVILPISYMQP
jgi:hypothetical protein